MGRVLYQSCAESIMPSRNRGTPKPKLRDLSVNPLTHEDVNALIDAVGKVHSLPFGPKIMILFCQPPCPPFLFAPILFGLPRHRRCARILHLEPIRRAPGERASVQFLTGVEARVLDNLGAWLNSGQRAATRSKRRFYAPP
jgi:hypothetical protein